MIWIIQDGREDELGVMREPALVREFDSDSEDFIFHVLRSTNSGVLRRLGYDSFETQSLVALLAADFLDRGGKMVGSTRVASVTSVSVATQEVAVVRFDAVIICALAKEHLAILQTFGVKIDSRPDFLIDGHKCYSANLKLDLGGSLTVLLTCVNAPRNVKMAILTTKLIDKFNPTLAFLCGITAGRPTVTNICDVIISGVVADIAGGKSYPDGQLQRRDEWFRSSGSLAKIVDYFPKNESRWQEQVRQALNSADQASSTGFISAARRVKMALSIHKFRYATDEFLKRDGDWVTLEVIDDRIGAYEMESSGFAQACDEGHVEWLIFKACADFGNNKKNDKSQQTAAFVSGFALKSFLQEEFFLSNSRVED